MLERVRRGLGKAMRQTGRRPKLWSIISRSLAVRGAPDPASIIVPRGLVHSPPVDAPRLRGPAAHCPLSPRAGDLDLVRPCPPPHLSRRHRTRATGCQKAGRRASVGGYEEPSLRLPSLAHASVRDGASPRCPFEMASEASRVPRPRSRVWRQPVEITSVARGGDQHAPRRG